MSLGEFDLIARYFARHTTRSDVLLGRIYDCQGRPTAALKRMTNAVGLWEEVVAFKRPVVGDSPEDPMHATAKSNLYASRSGRALQLAVLLRGATAGGGPLHRPDRHLGTVAAEKQLRRERQDLFPAAADAGPERHRLVVPEIAVQRHCRT